MPSKTPTSLAVVALAIVAAATITTGAPAATPNTPYDAVAVD